MNSSPLVIEDIDHQKPLASLNERNESSCSESSDNDDTNMPSVLTPPHDDFLSESMPDTSPTTPIGSRSEVITVHATNYFDFFPQPSQIMIDVGWVAIVYVWLMIVYFALPCILYTGKLINFNVTVATAHVASLFGVHRLLLTASAEQNAMRKSSFIGQVLLFVSLYSHVVMGVMLSLESSSTSFTVVPFIVYFLTLVLEVAMVMWTSTRHRNAIETIELDPDVHPLLWFAYHGSTMVVKGFIVYCNMLFATLLLVIGLSSAHPSDNDDDPVTFLSRAWSLGILIACLGVMIDIPLLQRLIMQQGKMSISFAWCSLLSNLAMFILTCFVMKYSLLPNVICYVILWLDAVVVMWINFSIVVLTRQLPSNPDALPLWFPMRQVVHANMVHNQLNIFWPFTVSVEIFCFVFSIGSMLMLSEFSSMFLAVCSVCFVLQTISSIGCHLFGLKKSILIETFPHGTIAKQASTVYMIFAALTSLSGLVWAVTVTYFEGLHAVFILLALSGCMFPKSLAVFSRSIAVYQQPVQERLIRAAQLTFKFCDGYSDMTVGIVLLKNYVTRGEFIIAIIVLILSTIDFPLIMLQATATETPTWFKNLGRFSELVILVLTLVSMSSTSMDVSMLVVSLVFSVINFSLEIKSMCRTTTVKNNAVIV